MKISDGASVVKGLGVKTVLETERQIEGLSVEEFAELAARMWDRVEDDAMLKALCESGGRRQRTCEPRRDFRDTRPEMIVKFHRSFAKDLAKISAGEVLEKVTSGVAPRVFTFSA